MGSYHAQDVSIDRPWQFAPWDNLSVDPEWIIRGMWYRGRTGEYVVVEYSFSDSWLGYSGYITRFDTLEHAEAHFVFCVSKEVDDLGFVSGVYLFRRYELLKQAGSRFSEYTGLDELPDGRW